MKQQKSSKTGDALRLLIMTARVNVTRAHWCQWAAMHGAGLPSGCNLGFSVMPKDTYRCGQVELDLPPEPPFVCKSQCMCVIASSACPTHVDSWTWSCDRHIRANIPKLTHANIPLWCECLLFILIWDHHLWPTWEWNSCSCCDARLKITRRKTHTHSPTVYLRTHAHRKHMHTRSNPNINSQTVNPHAY